MKDRRRWTQPTLPGTPPETLVLKPQLADAEEYHEPDGQTPRLVNSPLIMFGQRPQPRTSW